MVQKENGQQVMVRQKMPMLNMFLSGVASLLIPLLATAYALGAEKAADRPNIVLILCDDLGYADVGFNAQHFGVMTDVVTPNIDALAKRGTMFSQAYVAHPFCGPSRMALLSGRMPHCFGGQKNLPDVAKNLRDYNQKGIPESETLISTVLQSANYSTACIGKWHLGDAKPFHPVTRGFDQFFGFLGGYVDYYRHREFSDLDVLFNGQKPVEAEGYMTDLITDRAVQFVDEASSRNPFFLYVAYSVPHFPFQPPGSDPGKMVAKEELTLGTRKNYVAMLEDMDRGVGQILESLDKRGLTDNTLVVFASDHGAIAPGSNAPFQGFKSGLFEGGIRTACMMRWPGHLPAGTISNQPTITMDLTTSFVHAGNGKTPAGYKSDGIDIVGHLSQRLPDTERTLAWRAKREDRVWRAIRHGDWKLVTRFEDGKRDEWLFNLKTDPAEKIDQSENHSKLKVQLSSQLVAWETETSPSR